MSISAAAAQYLVDRRVRAVGVDYLSVGGYVHDGVETHRILLGAGIGIMDGLNLASVAPGPYDLICLPLRVAGADGAPAPWTVHHRQSRDSNMCPEEPLEQ